jgi:hypothetical protein
MFHLEQVLDPQGCSLCPSTYGMPTHSSTCSKGRFQDYLGTPKESDMLTKESTFSRESVEIQLEGTENC